MKEYLFMVMLKKMIWIIMLLTSIPLINLYLSPFMELARVIQIYTWLTKNILADPNTIINQVTLEEIT